VARGRERIREPLGCAVRGVSNAREGSEILSFLFRPRLAGSLLLHLRSSWKVNSANFALTEFYEVRSGLSYSWITDSVG
jgi:hypothetical protein